MNAPRGNHCGLCKLYKFNLISIRISFFSERIMNPWNYLPENMVDFSSTRSNKITIMINDFSRSLKCFETCDTAS
jgi:hypothetical protein